MTDTTEQHFQPERIETAVVGGGPDLEVSIDEESALDAARTRTG